MWCTNTRIYSAGTWTYTVQTQVTYNICAKCARTIAQEIAEIITSLANKFPRPIAVRVYSPSMGPIEFIHTIMEILSIIEFRATPFDLNHFLLAILVPLVTHCARCVDCWGYFRCHFISWNFPSGILIKFQWADFAIGRMSSCCAAVPNWMHD